ncbi:MAG: hypothetical protein KC620_13490, partial [Myxococcales bacterium]|nr:hypothetical protein [Myxococcales bacterium]
VHCDVCHRVESIDPAAPPGVAGRLHLVRPSESAPITLGAGGLLPLTFGPGYDSPNPRMGSVQRDHYRNGAICQGCHQLDAAPRLPGAALDRARWPDGTLPLQSTFAEWQASPYADIAPCQSCHMPPEPAVSNSADLQAFPAADIGLQGGWLRAPGTVRRHSWTGPRFDDTLLNLAAAVFIDKSVADGVLTAQVTVQNVGAGHALPTGEPLRHLLLTVEARCADAPLAPIGGEALPAFAGAIAGKPAGADWRDWPEARVGDVIRVVRRPGGFRDYTGFGPFGDRFRPEEKGLPIEEAAGQATVLEVEPLVLSNELPEGDQAWLTRGPALAGAPGAAFARVLVDPEGQQMVPHFAAVDVARDNRLLPGARSTSEHRFAADCAEPIVEAHLIYRPWPEALRVERRFVPRERVIAEARR